MNKHTDDLLRLSGTAEEKAWLEERLGMLSVKEGIILDAAMQHNPPDTMADAVNCLLTLNQYIVHPADSYEELGKYCLWEYRVPYEHQSFFDMTALGHVYEDEHPGLFIGNSYVAYPAYNLDMPYDGIHLPTDAEHLDWSVRLKLASEAVPDGVWMKLPDYQEGEYGGPHELLHALDALQVKRLSDCTLLEYRCSLPRMGDAAHQYGSLSDLIHDGQEFGAILDRYRYRQSGEASLEKFLAILEYEDCYNMHDAINISAEQGSYELIDTDDFIDRITQALNKEEWTLHGDSIRGCFDFTAYAGEMAKRRGYQMTDDGHYYIRKRDSPVLEQQSTGMTMH